MSGRTQLPAYPAYQDIATLTHNLCISERTVDAWVKQGILPPPRARGGKRLWKWAEVEQYLDTVSLSPDAQAEDIKNATRSAAAESRQGHGR